MDSAQLIIILLILFGVAVIALFLFLYSQIKSLKQPDKGDEKDVLLEWLKEMKNSVDKSSDTLERQLTDQRESLMSQLKTQRESMDRQTKVIWERLENATKVIGDVQKHLGGLQEFSKDMKDLSNVLKAPKLRGGLGEQFLYEVLASALPKNLYATQHRFDSGSICDAVVFTEKGTIPIDAKFPMENFKAMLSADSDGERESSRKAFIRDVKGRIDEISTKYILPQEGTTEQAVMYIPSETIYYEVIVGDSGLDEYAKRKKVVMASPNTIMYLLRIIFVAYQQFELQKNAGEILNALMGIKHEAQKFGDELGVLKGHIGRTGKSMVSVNNEYKKFLEKLDSVEALGDGVQDKVLGEGDSKDI